MGKLLPGWLGCFCSVPVMILLVTLGVVTLVGCSQGEERLSGTEVKREFRLALVQMLVEGGNKAGNLDRATARIAEAARNGAQIALLPEVADLGWTHSAALSQAEPVPGGSFCRALMKAAADHSIYVVAGLTERDGDQVFNSAVLIDSKGELLIRHRKLNELSIAHDLYDQGDRLNVCQTEFGTLGLLICADATAANQTLLRSLGYMGADIILSPSAWAVPPNHDNLEERYGDTWRVPYRIAATEFRLWVVGVSNVGKIVDGPWKDWNCIGCSLAIDPQGREVVQGPYGAEADTILYVDVKTVPRPARGTGWNDYWVGR